MRPAHFPNSIAWASISLLGNVMGLPRRNLLHQLSAGNSDGGVAGVMLALTSRASARLVVKKLVKTRRRSRYGILSLCLR